MNKIFNNKDNVGSTIATNPLVCTAFKRGVLVLLALTMIITTFSATLVQATNSVFDVPQYFGQEDMRGVYDAKTSTTKTDLELAWKTPNDINDPNGNSYNDISGLPIIVGDYVYVYYAQYIRKLDLKTGNEICKTEVFSKSSNQFFVNIAYGDGKIFVPVKLEYDASGKEIARSFIKVYDAINLTPLYVTEKFSTQVSGDMQSPLTYHDGYIVTGEYFGSKKYLCFDTKDDDTTKTDEVKAVKWSVTSDNTRAFNWNGAAFAKDYCIFADSGFKTGSTVWSVNYKTGAVVDMFALLDKWESVSTVVYNKADNRVYIAANAKIPQDGKINTCAGIVSFELNSNGTLNQNTKKVWTSGTIGGGTQATPVIYNNRIYLGGGGGVMGSVEPFNVIDAKTMKTIYSLKDVTVAGFNEPQTLLTSGSAAISTAYATKANNNQVYIYLVPLKPKYHFENNSMTYDEAYLWILKDKEGQTTPEVEIANGIGNPNFCSQTVAVAKDGSLIWYNDAAPVYCYKNMKATEYTAQDVVNQIERLPSLASLTYYNKLEIDRISSRYSELSAVEQANVTNYSKLKSIIPVAGMTVQERINADNTTQNPSSEPIVTPIVIPVVDDKDVTKIPQTGDMQDMVIFAVVILCSTAALLTFRLRKKD